MRGRIHGGTTEAIERDLFAAWRGDALTCAAAGRRTVLMIVASNEQAAVLSERARNALLDAGVVADGPTVRLRDNLASVGDHIVTRRNDRRLRTSSRGWVVNGDVWTVIAVHADGAVDARRHADAATITLPAHYLAEHTHLAYATTAHRAQGIGDHDDLPAPEQILSRVLQRKDPDRLSAHQVIADSLHERTCLARLGAIFDDAARTATDQWLRHTLTARGLGAAVDDQQWPSLIARVRETALAGHDPDALVQEAIRMRPIGDARSAAAVLHWRLGVLGATPAPRPRGPLASLPPVAGPAADVARQAGELMQARWRDLRASLAATTEPLPWAPTLGPRPSDPAAQSAWLTAATAVTAYRERYDVPAHTPMLGERPAASRPDARAAWDHACLQADRYLARRLHDLDDQALVELDAR
jgi:hypothetical protein